MIYQPSFQIGTIYLTLPATGCEPVEIQTLLLQGHVLVMYKALYGTRSGGACWNDKLFDILQQMDFKPSKADLDIWLRASKDGTHYKYIDVYVDDLAICMKDPKHLSYSQGSIHRQAQRCWVTKLPCWFWVHQSWRWKTCCRSKKIC